MDDVRGTSEDQKEDGENLHEDQERNRQVSRQVREENHEAVEQQQGAQPHHRPRGRWRLFAAARFSLDPHEEVEHEPSEEHVEILQGRDEEDLVDFSDATR